jgi:ribonuclease R
VYVEGLVHISELPSDYFHFDATKHTLLGERSGKQYRLGDRLQVKLVRVDLETSKIDFVLAEPSKKSSSGKKKTASKTKTASKSKKSL